MKKLLLSALLAASATSFAAVTTVVETGNEVGVLPVTVKGNVVEATKLTMELMALDNAGPDGRSMTFNFGDLVKGISVEQLQGSFQVRLLKHKDSPAGVKEIAFTGAPQYTLIKGTSPENAEQTETVNGVALTYKLQGTQGLAGVKVNRENLVVIANAVNGNVGTFTDASVKIKVTLQETGNSEK